MDIINKGVLTEGGSITRMNTVELFKGQRIVQYKSLYILLSVNGFSTSAVASCKVATLAHEAWNDAMK